MEEVSNLYIISDFTYAALCKRLHKGATRMDGTEEVLQGSHAGSSEPGGAKA